MPENATAPLTLPTQLILAGFVTGRSAPGATAENRVDGRVRLMAPPMVTEAPARTAKPWYKVLYVQVLIAILLGVVVGWLWPGLATNDWIKALGDGFIKLIKMVIAPIIFCTVVSGIAHIQD